MRALRRPSLVLKPCVRPAALVLLAGLALLATASSAGAAENTIAQPDSGGQYASLALDSAGNPVVSHYDPVAGDLRIVHCASADCTGGMTLASPDPTTNDVGQRTSLALAPGDVPIATYYDSDLFDLKFVHCGNPGCSAPTVRTLDSGPTGNVGLYSSITINASGNPVIAYYTEPFDILKLIVCANATCGSYSHHQVDTAPITGLYPSIDLDGAGFPVISYWDQTDNNLRLVHCGNATCTADNSFATPDGALGDVGKYTSLALDSSGFPVVSYYNETNGDLRVLHCGDAACSAGNVISTPDSTGNVGLHTSLVLDGAGNPAVSYYNATGTALRVLRCGDRTCSAGNTITTPDAAGTVGEYTSVALDGAGNPVVAYFDASDAKVNVLRCGDPACAGTSIAVGGMASLTGVLDVANEESSPMPHRPLVALVTVLAVLVVGWLTWRGAAVSRRGR